MPWQVRRPHTVFPQSVPTCGSQTPPTIVASASLERYPYYRLIVPFREPQRKTWTSYAFRRVRSGPIYIVA